MYTNLTWTEKKSKTTRKPRAKSKPSARRKSSATKKQVNNFRGKSDIIYDGT
jgi:hypothetical protein